MKDPFAIPQVHSTAVYGEARFELDGLFQKWTQAVERAESLCDYDSMKLSEARKIWTQADILYSEYDKQRVAANVAHLEAKLAAA